MKLIKSSFEILEQEPGLDGIYKAIERAGRTCYKSEDKITEDSAPKFVDMLINRGHTAVLEQGTVYLAVPWDAVYSCVSRWDSLIESPYAKWHIDTDTQKWYITTNFRVLYNLGIVDELTPYICEPTERHAKRVTVRVNCSIGISREWNRHRKLSVCEQSTRYCNYSKAKFNSQLTFVIPSWIKSIKPGDYSDDLCDYGMYNMGNEGVWYSTLQEAEMCYMGMMLEGAVPQQAREILPLSTATEVVYTGFIDDWEHFFDLRCDKAAHPDMLALTKPLLQEFIKRGYLNG